MCIDSKSWMLNVYIFASLVVEFQINERELKQKSYEDINSDSPLTIAAINDISISNV